MTEDAAARAAAIFGADVASITEEPASLGPAAPAPETTEGRAWHTEEHGDPCHVAGCYLAARLRLVEDQATQRARAIA